MGVLMIFEYEDVYKVDVVIICGFCLNLEMVVSYLYELFCLFNECDVDVIVSESFFEEGVGYVVMNWLMKVVGYYVIK